MQMRDSGGNQGRLGSGCVCDSGCESCDRLAEEHAELLAALRDLYLFGRKDAEVNARAAMAIARAYARAEDVKAAGGKP